MSNLVFIPPITAEYYIDFKGKMKWVACDSRTYILPLGIHDSKESCEIAIRKYEYEKQSPSFRYS